MKPMADAAPVARKLEMPDDDQARVDGVPSDRPLGSTASGNEVK